ncbi:MAG TPA: hypothetical protein VMT93_08575 [Gemmatimonadaceae bacterium]|nr:hypothetical protein [Gemmatimonadaceae bacterium]
MRVFQQTTAPTPAPQAPSAPEAPVVTADPSTMTPAQREKLKADIKKTVHDALQQAHDAQGGTPVIVGSGTIQPPLDQYQIRAMAENISTMFFVTVAVIAIGIPLVRALGRRLGPAPAPVAIPPQMQQQLERIEHTVEAMAIEIERIAESQRFLTKLQTGKEGAALPRAGGGQG